jgi:hypothetical protein
MNDCSAKEQAPCAAYLSLKNRELQLILQSLHEGQGINAVGRVSLKSNGTSAPARQLTKIITPLT